MSDRPLGVWWVLAAGLVVGLLLIADGHLLRGGYVIAGSLALSAFLRLVLPPAAAGSLAVRSRATDVVVMLALAAVLAGVLSVLDMRPRGPGSVNGAATAAAPAASTSTSEIAPGAAAPNTAAPSATRARPPISLEG